jgi:hypothetical protein
MGLVSSMGKIAVSTKATIFDNSADFFSALHVTRDDIQPKTDFLADKVTLVDGELSIVHEAIKIPAAITRSLPLKSRDKITVCSVVGNELSGLPDALKGTMLAIDCQSIFRHNNRSYVAYRKGSLMFLRGRDVKAMDLLIGRVLAPFSMGEGSDILSRGSVL